MAIYRNIQLSFWTDNKVEDDFTPEDKYFYLYLLTNPQTNICGCYEVSFSQMSHQTGYNKETLLRLLERFEKTHELIKYSKNTKEILILNWSKYNWSKSEKVLAGVANVAKYIKNQEFREYVFSLLDSMQEDNDNIPYQYGIETSASVSDSINNKEKEVEMRENFEKLYKPYPKHTGRTIAYRRYKDWVTKGRKVNGHVVKLTNAQIWDAIMLYKKEKDGVDKQFIKDFSTFMGDSLLDYVADVC